MSALLDSLLDAERKGQCSWYDEAMAKTLRDRVSEQASQDRQRWMFVGAAFQKPSPHCEECGYCEHKGQMLPYGEGQAYEAWEECSLGKLASDRPEMCPALAAHLAEQAEEAE